MGCDEQLSAAKFRAERDQARQECERLRARLRDSVPREAYERRRTAWLRQIRECETALHKRREHIKKLENAALERRTVREEDREAAEWVRGSGGLDSVKKLLDWVVGHCSTKQQLDFDFWLSGRVMYELGFDEDMADRDEVERRLLARLMPEGMEWPKVDGEPVDFVTGYEPSLGVLEAVCIYSNGACDVMGHDGIIKGVKEIHVVTPKVLDADGAEVEVGDDLYSVEGSLKFHVSAIDTKGGRIATEGMFALDKWADPKMYTHRAPVLAADGRPLREGGTVWEVVTGDGYVVERIYSGTTEPDFPGHTVACRRPDDIVTHMFKPSQLTHERPVLDAGGVPIKGGDTIYSDGHKEGLIVDGYQHDGSLIAHTRDGNHVAIRNPQHFTHAKPEPPDSWERIEEDANSATCAYFGVSDKNCGGCGHYSWDCAYDKARDLVRRAKALAGVDE